MRRAVVFQRAEKTKLTSHSKIHTTTLERSGSPLPSLFFLREGAAVRDCYVPLLCFHSATYGAAQNLGNFCVGRNMGLFLRIITVLASGISGEIQSPTTLLSSSQPTTRRKNHPCAIIHTPPPGRQCFVESVDGPRGG